MQNKQTQNSSILLALLREILNFANVCRHKKDLIENICQSISRSALFSEAWIVLINQKKRTLKHISSSLTIDKTELEKIFFNRLKNNWNKKQFTENISEVCSLLAGPNDNINLFAPLIYKRKTLGAIAFHINPALITEKEALQFLETFGTQTALSFHLISKTKKTKQKIEQLKNDQFLLNTLMDNLPEHIYFKNKKSEFLKINKSMSKLFGLESPEQAIGKTDFDFFTEEHAKPAFKDEQEILKRGIPLVGAEEKETWPDGKITWAVTTKMPLKNRTGKTIGTFGISRNITDQKQMEIALKQSETKFRMIIENQGEGIGITDENEIFTFANPAANQIFGIKNGTLINRSLLDFLSDETIEFIQNETKKRKQGDASKYEIEIIQPTGQKRIILVTTTPYKSDSGEFLGTFGVFRDITERVQTLNSLKLQKEQFELAVKGANDGVWDWNINSNVLFLSPRWKEQLGYKDEEIQNTFESFEKLLHHDDKKRTVEYVNSYLKGEFSIYNIEFRMRHKNGNYRWIQSKGEALRDENGVPYRMAGSHSDITERKLAEKKTEAAFKRLNSIMNSVQAGIMLIRKSDKLIIEANHAVEKMLGFKKNELLNKPCQNHICPLQSERCQLLNCGKNIENLEQTIKNHKGELIPILKNATVIEIEGEEYVLESFVDISQQKAAERELVEARKNAELANKAKSEFLANMSHEIRTPMNSILGFSEVLLNTTENEKHKGYIRTILNSGKTLLSLINDILDLSKIEAGRMEIIPDPADIRIVLNEVEKIFEPKVKNKNINYITEIADDFPDSVLLDEVRLRQILFNVVGNAVKFTPSGFIKVQLQTIRKNGATIDFEISVADSGIGISKEDHKKIFETFSQQSGHAARNYEGTGLGLAISKRLCEIMNGKIELQSEVGKGSTFKLFFNHIEYNENSLAIPDEYTWEDLNIQFEPAKILVVDDVSFNRNLIKSFFENDNFTLLEAENGESGVAEAKNSKPDLILMDIRMPGIDGYSATKILRKSTDTASIPVIALTASTMQDETDKILQLFDGYLRKPVQKNALVKELMKYFKYTKTEKIPNNKPQITIEKPGDVNKKTVDEFKKLFLQKIKEMQGMMIVDELEEFVHEMDIFANEKEINFLKQQTHLLQENIVEFDFEKINKGLAEIEEFFS